ncbi:Sulfate permease 2 [Xylographa opegraphella]|nr:Sulfate permease 2 [Xylographa opegraphella]
MAARQEGMQTKLGHGLAKVLGIKLHYREPSGKEKLTRGESVFSVSSADTYVEEEPTVGEWLREITPTSRQCLLYFWNLFPFLHWIGRYNAQWLFGDLVAGITVGAVVVPQGMAYATLAGLPPQFGLYSSFMGVLVYWLFATSKDITIGPVAVMSTITGNILANIAITNPDLPGHVVASALSLVCGAIICFFGLIRAGWIVDFIPLAAIAAYMTGSALNIACGQIPTMLGQSGFSTRDSTYLVIIHTLQYLPKCKIDAAMGLTALFLLYVIRSACKHGARRYPSKKKWFFFAQTLRTVFVLLLYTLISWLVNRNHRAKPIFKILGTVPRGFQYAAVPVLNKTIISSFAGQIPASVIVLLIEHIAIAKSFGRVNNYSINPSQELVGIGITNILGPFLGAYPATGSFSRTAINSKAGVRTPLAGVITALVVLLAIYALTAVFFYIPSASLSAVIIHAVFDLITSPNTLYQFWRVSPLEVIIFFAGVLVTVFSSIENGIYTTIIVSVAVLLFRVVKAKGRFLGRVKVHSVVGDRLVNNDGQVGDGYGAMSNKHDSSLRNIFLPIEHNDGSNPQVDVESPYPGIYIFRFSEGYNYPNANHYLDYMVATIFAETRRTNPDNYPRIGDRPWNDPGPRRGQPAADHSDRPTLKAIILDFSSVNNVDITSVQHLVDVRNQLDFYTAPNRVDWHMACINNRWTKRALASAGFGFPSPDDLALTRWKAIFSVAEIGGSTSAAAVAESRDIERDLRRRLTEADVEAARSERRAGGDGISRQPESRGESSESGEFAKDLGSAKAYAGQAAKVAVVHGLNRPLFHIDLTSALQSAIANVERRGELEAKGVGTGPA